MIAKIPGSEKFTSPPPTPAELRERVAPGLQLHTVSDEFVDSIDPLSYEVIRHRLWSITEEMGTALKRMSGSVAVTECNDFDFALTDELGFCAQIGTYNTMLAAGVDSAIWWTLEHRSANPGIADGDMWFCNDPWVGGGQHQSDVALYAPLFWDGKLFAWSSAVAHQMDLGGVSPGSWTPRSQDVFWESLPTPPVKMVREGVLQQDIEDLYVRRSRLPHLTALDVRAKMGANSIAHERLRELITKYGPDLVKAVMKRMMNDAERRLRAKLRDIPDGQWQAVNYQEQSIVGDRDVHKIMLTLTKRDDQMTFDFTGTDPQSGMINCTLPGLRGGILSAVLPLLAGDIPWATGGVARCFDIVSEAGTLNNATFPAGVCKGSVSSSIATTNVTIECLSKMLDTSPTYRDTGMAAPSGTFQVDVIAGMNRESHPFVIALLEPMASGLGARFDDDGVDTGGLVIIPQGRAPDAEMQELASPMLMLWRREETDSGGPGRFRGGVSGSVCWVPHGQDTPMACMALSAGKATSMNAGLAGGYPGSNAQDVILRDANVAELLASGVIPSSLEAIDARREDLQAQDETVFNPQDVFFMHWQGGGGYGDPIHRDPERVAHDVREHRVSVIAAHDIYGVAIDPGGAADIASTTERRNEIRAQRRARATVRTA